MSEKISMKNVFKPVTAACMQALILIGCGGNENASTANSLESSVNSSQIKTFFVSTESTLIVTDLAPAISLNTKEKPLYENEVYKSQVIPYRPDVSNGEREYSQLASPRAGSASPQLYGAWSDAGSWPLIPLHAALLPDGQVMTYGTDANGKQTGLFIYDVWNPTQDVGSGHLTLPNGTNTDIFCSAQTLLPVTGALFIAGGDNYVNGATSNNGNNNSNVFDYTNNTLIRGQNMNRPRWYGSVTTMAAGYIRGKRYSPIQVFSVALLTVGVLISAWADATSKVIILMPSPLPSSFRANTEQRANQCPPQT